MKELFSSWHEHSLHWRTRRSLEAHLEGCPPCRVFFQSMEETIVLVREWPGVEVPPRVRGHLRELLRERHDAAPAKRGCGCARPAPKKR
jgi:hypothetical protein